VVTRRDIKTGKVEGPPRDNEVVRNRPYGRNKVTQGLESSMVYGVQKWEKLTQKRDGNDSLLEEAMMD
jgi:hypothetical protein